MAGPHTARTRDGTSKYRQRNPQYDTERGNGGDARKLAGSCTTAQSRFYPFLSAGQTCDWSRIGFPHQGMILVRRAATRPLEGPCAIARSPTAETSQTSETTGRIPGQSCVYPAEEFRHVSTALQQIKSGLVFPLYLLHRAAFG
jgi:hypothetical protein